MRVVHRARLLSLKDSLFTDQYSHDSPSAHKIGCGDDHGGFFGISDRLDHLVPLPC